MSLFKKKTCCCGNAAKEEACCAERIGAITSVKVLGAGCASCHRQYENAKEAIKELGLSVEVEYITDLQIIMNYGVMSMPAIVVNEKVISAGKILSVADLKKALDTSI